MIKKNYNKTPHLTLAASIFTTHTLLLSWWNHLMNKEVIFSRSWVQSNWEHVHTKATSQHWSEGLRVKFCGAGKQRDLIPGFHVYSTHLFRGQAKYCTYSNLQNLLLLPGAGVKYFYSAKTLPRHLKVKWQKYHTQKCHVSFSTFLWLQ